MNEETIKEVFSDEEFVISLAQLQTPEEVQAALEEKDIDLSIAEIKKLGAMLRKKEDGELSEDELENVAGGYGTFDAMADGLKSAGKKIANFFESSGNLNPYSDRGTFPPSYSQSESLVKHKGERS